MKTQYSAILTSGVLAFLEHSEQPTSQPAPPLGFFRAVSPGRTRQGGVTGPATPLVRKGSPVLRYTAAYELDHRNPNLDQTGFFQRLYVR